MHPLKVFSKVGRLGLMLLLSTVLVFASCGSTKEIPAVSDSVKETEKVVERDTNIVAPGATANFSIPVSRLYELPGFSYNIKGTTAKVSAPYYIHLGENQNKQAKAEASVKDGVLNVKCTCDSLGILAKLRDRLKEKQTTRTVILPPVEIKYVPWYTKALAWVGGAALIIGVWVAYISVKRKFFS